MVDGLRTFIDGKEGGPVVIFVHGWPDDHKLWDLQVAHFNDRYLCVTTNLPGFGEQGSKWGHSFDDVAARLEKTIETVGKGKPVILVAHDWGCMYAFKLEKKRPDLVRRFVALDVGGAISMWPSVSLFAIIMYQTYLTFAFLIGGPIGNSMARLFARLVRAPSASTVAKASVCYPYFYFWKAKLSLVDLGPYTPRCPVLYMYGNKGLKKFMKFHADWWTDKIKRREGSYVVEMPDASHWLMLEQPDVVNGRLDAFLAED